MNDHRDLQNRLARLPSVDALLKTPVVGALCEQYPRSSVVAAVREVLQGARTALIEHRSDTSSPDRDDLDALGQTVAARLTAPSAMSFRRAINATGILFHDALGGPSLSPAAREAITTACDPVLFDAPDRDGWSLATEQLLCPLTGAEAALVVNNATAAVWLAIDTLSRGKEVIISRGHLAALDDNLRLLDLIERCGARTREVGATNKTHAKDYRAAIGDDTGAVFAIRPSTYSMRGFVQDVPVEELVRISAEKDVPVLYDLGHATLTPVTHADWRPVGSVREVVQAGVAVAVIGGDGLVGGPECGILTGQRALIDRLRQNPLARVVRPGKLTYTGLEAVLRQIEPSASGLDHHPALWMLSDPIDRVTARATRLLTACQARLDRLGAFDLIETVAHLTPSRLPSERFPSRALSIRPGPLSAQSFAERLRQQSPAVLGALVDDRVILDLRTVADREIDAVIHALDAVLKNACGNP
ncbi:MAG: L-seryl-tRNA(Sec) selenium transferase [Candidatus Latescibacteria bacterium]|nr:L-seryl-tRNA(Sec) selenium transferase [Candidatus Latescibacterota bacterium]